MIRGIDHLVIATADPDAAAAELESTLGIVSTGGGRHPGRGTWNRIAWLADGSYLELIGIDDRALALEDPIGRAVASVLDGNGAGLATYALRDDELEATVQALRGTESRIGDVTHGSRTREDGETVEWWTAIPAAPLGPAAAPFLIQHAYQGSEWGADALAARAGFRHPIGSPVVLQRLDVASAEPLASAARVNEALGLDVTAVADLAVCSLGPHVLRFVPRREMAVPAVITLGAEVESPVTTELLGLRFNIERAELPVAPARD